MKALVMRATPWRFAALQVLRPLSARLCYSGPFSTVRLEDIPEPRLPSPEWVRIQTILCGFCGSDLNLILMKDSPTAMPFTSFPCVPGHEICGRIVEAGKEAKGWKAGDLVAVSPQLNCEARAITPRCPSCAAGHTANCENYAEGTLAPGMFIGICRDVNGGFAPYLVAHRSQLFRVPPGVTPEEAVITEPLAVALQAVLDNPPEKNERVLVIGGGVIGALAVKALRALAPACHITVSEPSPFAADYARECGADALVSGDLIGGAVAIARGRPYRPVLGAPIVMGGFHRIYDTVGHRETLYPAMRVLATGGVLSVLGIGNDVKLDMTPLWLKLQTLRGCYAYGMHGTGRGRRPVFGMALEMIAKKRVRVAGMLTHTFSLEEYPSMIEVNRRKTKHGAIKTAVRFP